MSTRQAGTALITALLLLVVITILSLTAVRSSTQELRMATNQESRIDAFQTAVALIDGVIETPGNLIIFGSAGFKNCTSNVINCGKNEITLPSAAPFSDPLVEKRVTVVMQNADGAPPRTIGTSIDKFGAASFAIHAESTLLSDNTDRFVRAKSRAGQGFMLLVPKTSQTN